MQNLQFTLKTGDQIAATASSLVFADTKSNSNVELIAEKAAPANNTLENIEKYYQIQ